MSSQSNECTVSIGPISVPKHYIGAIPADRRPFYSLLGIRYVCVKHGDIEYNILEQCIGEMVRSLGLYQT